MRRRRALSFSQRVDVPFFSSENWGQVKHYLNSDQKMTITQEATLTESCAIWREYNFDIFAKARCELLTPLPILSNCADASCKTLGIPLLLSVFAIAFQNEPIHPK
jgi:hypothetical protein